MRYTIGIMACIAIVFFVITSPDKSQSRAELSPVEASRDTRIDVLVSSLSTMQDSIEALASEVQEVRQLQASGSFVSAEVASLSDKIAKQEAKLVAVVNSPPASAPPPPVVGDICNCNCDELEKRIAALEDQLAKLMVTKAKPAAPQVSSTPYQPRWHNYDGRTARQHAIESHGFDPSLSDAQLARLHDAYHDQYGEHPPTAAPVYRSRSTVVQSPMTSNCPGGVCPTTSRTTTVQSGGGLMGFGILGRRR